MTALYREEGEAWYYHPSHPYLVHAIVCELVGGHVEVYRSLLGTDMYPNQDNRPSTSPAHWSLLKELEEDDENNMEVQTGTHCRHCGRG